MAQYVRQSNKLLLKGMNVTLPGNRLGMEWAQLIRNLRSYRIGEWRQRPGLVDVAEVDAGNALVFHSRINDFANGTFRRVIGADNGSIYVDNAAHDTFTVVDTGYSGNPMTGFIARPDRSPNPFLFVGDDNRQGKFDKVGNRTEWGLSAPTVPPTAELGQIGYNTINTCDTSGGFAGSGGTVSNPSRYSAVAITNILFDSGSTGYASIQPASMDENFQEGSFITFSNGPETVIIESVYPSFTSTTIESIRYDSGTTGECTIELTEPTTGLQRNSLVILGGTEAVRVLSVTLGLDNIPSFRCSTVGTFAAGATVTGVRSFRAFCTLNHTTAETLSLGYVQLAVTGAGIATLSKPEPHDLTVTTQGANGRPLQEDDYIHLSLRVEDFSLISEIQLQFDFDATTNDFTQNYYFKSIRQPDLLAAYEQTATSLTAQQQRIQRQQLDDFTRQKLEKERADLLARQKKGFGIIPSAVLIFQDRINEINRQLSTGFLTTSGEGALSEEGAGGANQWTELKIPFKEFQRVGSDTTRGWKDTKAFQISVNATGAVDIGLSSLWAGGSYGADFGRGVTISSNFAALPTDGYEYAFRARNDNTGSVSNPSPPTRYQVFPEREPVIITIPSGYPDSQATNFDIFRRGGTLGDWHFVATVPSNDLTFIDDLPDETVVTQVTMDVDRFKPWPRPDLPKSGTVDVIGTKVIWKGGDLFKTQWVRGTQILIANKAYTFYTNPSSTTELELNESAGSLSDVDYQIPEPLLDGQPLPIVFGPYSGAGAGEFSFGLGDPLNPGIVYYTNGNDPESASDVNILELCGPSEKLVAGGILDGIIYVWSDRRSWRILPSFNGGQTGAGSAFYAQETSMGKGLASKWGVAFGDQIYFISWDGIYATKGDALVSLTDESLAPLFRRDGTESTFNSFYGVSPISFSEGNQKYMSLTYSRDGLYFTERDIEGNQVVWYYGFLNQGWSIDSYTPESSRIFRESGGTADVLLMGSFNGFLYQYDIAERDDAGSTISFRMVTREEDWGDSRAQKQMGDVAIDVDPGAVNTINVRARYDYNLFDEDLGNLQNQGRNIQVLNFNNGAGALYRSVALDFTWDSTPTGVSFLYEWQPAALLKPEYTSLRYTDWDATEYEGPKWVQGFRLHADTYNQPFQFIVQKDEGVNTEAFMVTHDGEAILDYSFTTPFITHMLRIVPQDSIDNWRFFDVKWIYEPEPPLVNYWETQFTSLDMPQFGHIRDMLIAYRSTSVTSLVITTDDGAGLIYSLPSTGGERSKFYIPSQAIKGKIRSFKFIGADPISLYLYDCTIRAKPWGSTGPYQTYRPFGDRTRDIGQGARI